MKLRGKLPFSKSLAAAVAAVAAEASREVTSVHGRNFESTPRLRKLAALAELICEEFLENEEEAKHFISFIRIWANLE